MPVATANTFVVLLLSASWLVNVHAAVVPHRDSSETPIMELGVPVNMTDPDALVPTASFRWATPMAPRRIAKTTPPTVAVGTDEGNCAVRDADRLHVAAAPVEDFVEFAFNVSVALRSTWLQFELDSYATDSLSNSFWLQIDNQTADETTELTIPSGSGSIATHTVVLGRVGVFEERCVRFVPNASSPTPERHTVRLYARQAGAAVSRLRVYRVPGIAVQSVSGCHPACDRHAVNAIQFTLAHLCGPSQLQTLRVNVNGAACTNVQQIDHERILCSLHPNAFDAVPPSDAIATLNVVITDASTGLVHSSQSVHVAVLADPRSPGGLRGAQVYGVLAGLIVVAVLIVALGAVALHTRRGARDTAHAPREAPMAFLFTDIEDSTALWGAYTRSMAAALDTHHAVIRAAIAAHKGYEVKTIGDAFMIACKSPGQAFAIAAEVQRELHRQSWPRCITGHYLGAADADDEPGDVAGAGPADAFVGVRVRIGIHVGAADATFDEVTQGFDYYGPAVNATARTESAARGGQILATREAVKCLEPGSGLSVAAEGVVELKGIGPTALCELAVDGLPSVRRCGVASVADDELFAHVLDSASHDASESDHGASVPVEAFTMEGFRTCLFREAASRMMHNGLPSSALQAFIHDDHHNSGGGGGAFAATSTSNASVAAEGRRLSWCIGDVTSSADHNVNNHSFSSVGLLGAPHAATPTVEAPSLPEATVVGALAGAIRGRVASLMAVMKPLGVAKQEETLKQLLTGWRSKSARLPRSYEGAVAALPLTQQSGVRALRCAVACVERSLPTEILAARPTQRKTAASPLKPSNSSFPKSSSKPPTPNVGRLHPAASSENMPEQIFVYAT